MHMFQIAATLQLLVLDCSHLRHQFDRGRHVI